MGEESYCREIEAYLCRKNDGHLIRVVGPAFEMVSRWGADGVPLKVAFSGIDRTCERYYRKGPRRRPLRIEFCEADVLEAFDDWCRALGLSKHALGTGDESSAEPRRRGVSVPSHLRRALVMLTSARAAGRLGTEADAIIDRLSGELDAIEASGRTVRGDARHALIERLAALDADLVAVARRTVADEERTRIDRDAIDELASFRGRMSEAAYAKARELASDRLLRERLALPTIELRDSTR